VGPAGLTEERLVAASRDIEKGEREATVGLWR
jgi:hypothetical protein